jgi:hypothetical protein
MYYKYLTINLQDHLFLIKLHGGIFLYLLSGIFYVFLPGVVLDCITLSTAVNDSWSPHDQPAIRRKLEVRGNPRNRLHRISPGVCYD